VRLGTDVAAGALTGNVGCSKDLGGQPSLRSDGGSWHHFGQVGLGELSVFGF